LLLFHWSRDGILSAVLGIAVFTGLLTILAFVAAFMQSVKFDNQYDAKAALAAMLDSSWDDSLISGVNNITHPESLHCVYR